MDRDKLFIKWDKLINKNKTSWIGDYISKIKRGECLDVDFLDYQGFRLFLIIEEKIIKRELKSFKQSTGGNVGFNDAGWGMYLVATGRAGDLETALSEYAEA